MKTVITTDKARFHKPNLEITVTDAVADRMLANGWATLVGEVEAPEVEAPEVEDQAASTENNQNSKTTKNNKKKK